jgi:hypothetical protein
MYIGWWYFIGGLGAMVLFLSSKWSVLVTYGLLPVLSLVPLPFLAFHSMAADRYMYLPMIAVGLWMGESGCKRWKLVVCLLLAAKSVFLVYDWRDVNTLYEQGISRTHPDSAFIMGRYYDRLGDDDKALIYYKLARYGVEKHRDFDHPFADQAIYKLR